MKISWFQGIVMAVFALSAVVGLIVFSLWRGSSSADDIGSVVIWGALPKAQIDDVLNDDETFKNVSYVEHHASTLRGDLINAIAQGSGPDMVLISHEDLFALYKFLQLTPAATLSERTFKDTFVSGSEVYLAPDGAGTYGIPFLIDPLVLFVNRTILASSGIAVPPTTWEALTGLVPLVVTKTPTGNVNRALVALGAYTNVHDARGILSALFLQAGVPISTTMPNGSYQVNLGAVQAQGGALLGQAVLRFYTQFADPTKASYTWNTSLPDSQASFASGDLALYVGYASESAYFRAANPNLDFTVTPLPQLATSALKTTYGLMYAFSIPRGSANPTGAYKAATALSSLAPNQAAALATSMAPALRALFASPPQDAVGAVAYTSALYAKSWLSPAPESVDRIFSGMITNVISGRLTVANALSSAENALSALLQ